MSILAPDDLGTTRSARRALSDASDVDLLEQVRAGDDDAYAELYRRHEMAARSLARHLERSSAAADDLVSETFTAVLVALRNGSGPTEAFRPYLLTALRRRHWRRAASPEEPADPTDAAFDAAVLDDDSDDGRLMAEAFRSLPERWQLVLWHTEIEGAPPAEVAPLVGLSPHATAALAHRAREGLREAYLQVHLQKPGSDACEATITRMGAHVRGNLGQRDQTKTDAHLADCQRCQGLRHELADINRSLRSIVAPVVLGSATAAYLGRRVVATPSATSTVAHSLRGSGRRLVVVGTTLALAVGLLVSRSDLVDRTPDDPATVDAQPAAASPATGSTDAPAAVALPTVRTVALPDGPSMTAIPGALGTASCASGTVAAGGLTTAAGAEGGIVRAVLFRGDLGGLAATQPGTAVTAITGSARTTLQSLAGPGATSAPTGGGAGSSPTASGPACISVASNTLLTGTGTWHLLVGYVPTTAADSDEVHFAVLDKPFALLGGITRTALGIARDVLVSVVSALPGIVGALTGQIDPIDIDDLSAVTGSLRSTLDDVLGTAGNGAGTIGDDTVTGTGAILDDLLGGGTGTGNGTGTSGPTGTPIPPTGTPTPPVPPTSPPPSTPPPSVPGPVTLPPMTPTLPPVLPPLGPLLPDLPLPPLLSGLGL